jgi:hypothetical protein
LSFAFHNGQAVVAQHPSGVFSGYILKMRLTVMFSRRFSDFFLQFLALCIDWDHSTKGESANVATERSMEAVFFGTGQI